MTAFHDRQFIETMHAEQRRLHGGAAGLRDEGMLESALARPLQKAAYGEPDLFELAAAYLFGLVKNHPFIDGNKRIALAAADTFLVFNGQSIETTSEDLVQLVLLTADGTISEEGVADFLRDVSQPFG